MEETYRLKAIIIKRLPFREFDSKVTVYSLEQGKLDLVARGTRKLASKLVGHLEPITLSNIMAVRGRQFDYVGSAYNEYCFAALKNNLEKVNTAGITLSSIDSLIKHENQDKNIFGLLFEFLRILDKERISFHLETFASLFLMKVISELGYQPELNSCMKCKKTIEGDNNKFDYRIGGLVCPNCKASHESLTINDDLIKILRFTTKNNLNEIRKLNININNENFIKILISSFVKHID